MTRSETESAVKRDEGTAALWTAWEAFFARAERGRLWSVDDDLPWSELSRLAPSPTSLSAARRSLGLENLAAALAMNALGTGACVTAPPSFAGLLLYGPSKRAMALRRYLARSGAADEAALPDSESGSGSENGGRERLPTPTSLASLARTLRLTSQISSNVAERARTRAGDDVLLDAILGFVTKDHAALTEHFGRPEWRSLGPTTVVGLRELEAAALELKSRAMTMDDEEQTSIDRLCALARVSLELQRSHPDDGSEAVVEKKVLFAA